MGGEGEVSIGVKGGMDEGRRKGEIWGGGGGQYVREERTRGKREQYIGGRGAGEKGGSVWEEGNYV